MPFPLRLSRIPVSCRCGARLSVLAKLKGEAIECPACGSRLIVSRTAVAKPLTGTPTVPILSGPGVEGGTNKEPTQAEPKPVQRLSPTNVQQAVPSPPTQTAALSSPQQGIDPAKPRTPSAPNIARSGVLKGIRNLPADCDIFGFRLTDQIATVTCHLDESVPKTYHTLKSESGASGIRAILDRLVRERKVKVVSLPSGEKAFIIHPEWIEKLQRGEVNLTAGEPTNRGAAPGTAGQTSTPGDSDRDEFGTLLTDPLSKVNALLSEQTPRSVAYLERLSNCKRNVTRHLETLRRDGKVRYVSERGQSGWIIDSEWLKRQRTKPQPFRPIGVAVIDPEPNSTSSAFQSPSPPTSVRPPEPSNFVTSGNTEPRNAGGGENKTPTVPPPRAPSPHLGDVETRAFKAIERWLKEKGMSPTIPELQAELGLGRFETLTAVETLVRKGFLEFNRGDSRGLRVIPEDERISIDPIAPAAVISQQNEPLPFEPQAPGTATSTQTNRSTSPQQLPEAPVWIDRFLKSDVLRRQYERAGRRAPSEDDLSRFVSAVIAKGPVVNRDSLCQLLGLQPLRLPGYLSMMIRLLNVDDVQILIRHDTGDIRVNEDLLLRQFQIT